MHDMCTNNETFGATMTTTIRNMTSLTAKWLNNGSTNLIATADGLVTTAKGNFEGDGKWWGGATDTTTFSETYTLASTTLLSLHPDSYKKAAEDLSGAHQKVIDQYKTFDVDLPDFGTVRGVVEQLYLRYAEGLLIVIPKVKDLNKKKRKTKASTIIKTVEGKTNILDLCPPIATLVGDIKALNDLETDNMDE